MKLSEAIIKKPKLPQGYGVFMNFDLRNDEPIASCALGGLNEKFLKKYLGNYFDFIHWLKKTYPELNELVSKYPSLCEYSSTTVNDMRSIYDLILHLNDKKKMTRKQISDILKKAGL